MNDDTPYENRTALAFVLPFVIVYALLFLYPTWQMVAMSLTDAQLTRPGAWVGLANYAKLWRDSHFGHAVINTGFFVLVTVLPSTLLGLVVAMMVRRLSGFARALILAVFFLPYVLPVSVVTTLWWWMLDASGPLNPITALFTGNQGTILRKPLLVLPIVAVVTVWWTIGFNVLLFLAGLNNIPPEVHEAATLDGAGRWTQFRSLTWPLIWPVTALVLTIQLIAQLKIFDQLYLLSYGTGNDANNVLVAYIYSLAFQRNQGGYASAVAVALFVIVVVVSVLQYQTLRARGAR